MSAAAGTMAKDNHSVILTIAAKELREILRDGRFGWLAAIMAILLLASLVAGWQRHAAYAAMETAAQTTSNGQFYTQGDKNPHAAAHYGNYAFRQAGPLSFFDSGISAYAGSFIFLEAHRQNLALAPPAGDVSAISRFGDLSGAMILQVLMPLLVIFLGFAAFSGERERRTLQQLLSIGVRPRDLLWGKALGIGTAAGLVIVPCVLIGAIALSLVDIAPSGDAIGLRIGVLAAAYLAYALVFLFITLGVSALSASPRTALIALVGFWTFSVFLMPRMAGEISKAVHPSPSLGEFQTAMQASRITGLGGPPPRARLQAYKQQLLEKYGVANESQLPVYWVSASMQKLEEMDHDVYDHYYLGLDRAYRQQERLQDRLGVLSPDLALGSISMGLAGTDLLHQQRFARAAEAARRVMVSQVNNYLNVMAAGFNKNALADASVSIEANDMVLIADESVFKMVEPFHYSPPDLGEVLQDHRGDFLLLGLWLVLATIFATVTASRLRPER